MIRMTRWSVSIQSSLTPHYGTLLEWKKKAITRMGQYCLGTKMIIVTVLSDRDPETNQPYGIVSPRNAIIPKSLVINWEQNTINYNMVRDGFALSNYE